MLLGAIITVFVFSCTTPIRNSRSVLAQDRTRLSDDLLGSIPGFRSVAQHVLPSVVEVRVSGFGEEDSRESFEFFFGPRGNDSLPGNPGIGSGVVVDRIGTQLYVVTNDHVVGGAAEIVVVTNDGDEYDATLVGADPRRDLAVLVFEASDPEMIPIARFGDSDEMFVGDWVVAVGNPFGFASTVTAGIVSAKERLGPEGNISDFIQTDASINQGSSGGPLVNVNGEVVGINTWITTPTGINVGLGFAIPINNVKKAIFDIIEFGEVVYGWFGVEAEDITDAVSSDLGYAARDGALIAQVFGNSPASDGGVLPGDIVISLNGAELRDYLHLVRTVGDLIPGAVADLTLFRSGEVITRSVTIGRRRSDADIGRANREMWPGMAVQRVDQSLRSALGLPRGATGIFVSEVKPAAPPQAAGIRRGDVVVAINSESLENLLDFYEAVNDTEVREFEVEVLRRGVTLTFSLRRE